MGAHTFFCSQMIMLLRCAQIFCFLQQKNRLLYPSPWFEYFFVLNRQPGAYQLPSTMKIKHYNLETNVIIVYKRLWAHERPNKKRWCTLYSMPRVFATMFVWHRLKCAWQNQQQHHTNIARCYFVFNYN